jgi:tetratricopeptide (TPR) repeat protein
MLHELRHRWIALFLAIAILLALRPTPIAAPIVAPVSAAAQALSTGHPQMAASLFEDAIKFLPSNASLYLHAARSRLLAGDPNGALEILELADELMVDEIALEGLRGEALVALGNLDGATEAWESAEEAAPLPEEILRNLGQAYMEMGDTIEAYRAFIDLVTLLPDDLDALLHLGVLAAGTPATAEEYLQIAESHAHARHPVIQDLIANYVESEEHDSSAYRLALVGQTLMRYDEWQLAEYAFREALAVDPGYVDARAYHGLALLKIDGDGLPELMAALAADPEAMLPHILLGMHYLENGEAEDALRELELAAELDSTNPAVLAQLGAALDAVGEIDQAMLAYRSAAEMAPDDADFWLLLAQYALSKEIEVLTVALPAARNAVALKPRNAAGLGALGYGHYLLGNFSISERLLSRSVRMDPSLAQSQYYLGLLRLAQGQSSRARAALTLAVLLDPDGAVGHLAELALDYASP